MSTPAAVKNVRRATAYQFRMSAEDRELLHELAAAQGLTVQGYLERLVFGHEPVLPKRRWHRKGGRRAKSEPEELPMTG